MHVALVTPVPPEGPTTRRCFRYSLLEHQSHMRSQPLPQLLLNARIAAIGTSHVVSRRDTSNSQDRGNPDREAHHPTTAGISVALIKASRIGASRCTSSMMPAGHRRPHPHHLRLAAAKQTFQRVNHELSRIVRAVGRMKQSRQ